MVFLCSLRDRATGRYSHPALLQSLGREAADRTLCHNHHQVFMDWLRLNLAEQKADLDEYLRISRTAAANLPYRELVPPNAHEVERQLYLTDLEILLQLLSFEPAAAALPDASRPR